MTGSVTAACSGNVWIGMAHAGHVRDRALDQPAVQLTTTGVAIRPRLVCTPVTRPRSTSMPVTSVFWWMCTPCASAARA